MGYDQALSKHHPLSYHHTLSNQCPNYCRIAMHHSSLSLVLHAARRCDSESRGTIFFTMDRNVCLDVSWRPCCWSWCFSLSTQPKDHTAVQPLRSGQFGRRSTVGGVSPFRAML